MMTTDGVVNGAGFLGERGESMECYALRGLPWYVTESSDIDVHEKTSKQHTEECRKNGRANGARS